MEGTTKPDVNTSHFIDLSDSKNFALKGCIKGRDSRCRGGRWYCRNDIPSKDFGICQFCKDNGCYKNLELYAIDLETTDFDSYTCDCQQEASHPQIKLDCCPGKNEIYRARWYTPITGDRQFICQYCAENGCYENGSLRELYFTDNNFSKSCVCTKPHPHMVNIVCPTCSVSDQKTPVSYGTCHQCNDKISEFARLCKRCAYKYHWCSVHGGAIKSGDEYISDLIKQREAESSSTLEEINVIDARITRFKQELAGKNHIEVFACIVGKMRANS